MMANRRAQKSVSHFIHHYGAYSDTVSCDSNKFTSNVVEGKNYIVKVKVNDVCVFSVDLGRESPEIDTQGVVYVFSIRGLSIVGDHYNGANIARSGCGSLQ